MQPSQRLKEVNMTTTTTGTNDKAMTTDNVLRILESGSILWIRCSNDKCETDEELCPVCCAQGEELSYDYYHFCYYLHDNKVIEWCSFPGDTAIQYLHDEGLFMDPKQAAEYIVSEHENMNAVAEDNGNEDFIAELIKDANDIHSCYHKDFVQRATKIVI